MAKIAVCVEIFFGSLPYAERLKKIAALGFTAYEIRLSLVGSEMCIRDSPRRAAR